MALSKRSVCATLAPFPLLIAAVVADGLEGEERLPGSRVSLQEAIRLSRSIVVVRGVEMGMPSLHASSGKQLYGHARLKVVKSLKGDAKREIFPVSVMLITLPKAKERAPDRDREYLFFLKGPPGATPRAVKVLRATDENLRATLEAIRAGGNEVLGGKGDRTKRGRDSVPRPHVDESHSLSRFWHLQPVNERMPRVSPQFSDFGGRSAADRAFPR